MKMFKYIGYFIIVLVILIIGWFPYFYYGTSEEVIATVKGTERACSSPTNPNKIVECKYRVYTDIGTFENVDSYAYLKFNSADVQGELSEGHTYKMYVYGWRFGWLSWFKNIVSVEEIRNPNEKCGQLTTDDGEVLNGCFVKIGENRGEETR